MKSDDFLNEEFIDVWDDEGLDTSAVTQSPWQKSFDELRQKMVKVPDWDIYKRTMVEGTGEPLGDLRARVTYHYNFFFELGEEAFDSSYLRQTKMVSYTYDGTTLAGTLASLSTMRKGEEAQFVISYELMFGKLGSAPRIPPKADILAVVQLLEIEETGDEQAIETLPDEYKKKYLYVEEKANEVMKKAMDLYKQGRYSHSCRNYHTIARSLEFCNLANEDEEIRHQKFLVKIYTQLMLCYIKMEDWKKTCSMFNELKQISASNLNTNFQAHLNHGIALGKLGEFDRSLGHLRIAQKIDPHNRVVNKELVIVNETKQKTAAADKSFWRKAFKFASPEETKVANEKSVDEEMADAIDGKLAVDEKINKSNGK